MLDKETFVNSINQYDNSYQKFSNNHIPTYKEYYVESSDDAEFYSYYLARIYHLPQLTKCYGCNGKKEVLREYKNYKGNFYNIKVLNRNKFVKLLYYWIDFMMAPFKYGGIRSRGGIVLFDRHYIDMAVHPHRFEMGIPRKIILFLYRFIPKADYTFFLYCTPEEILQRKQEFTADEIKEQTEKYMKVGKSIRNFVPIHTNTTIAEEIDEILSHVAKNYYDS